MSPDVVSCRTGPLAWVAPQGGQEHCSIHNAKGQLSDGRRGSMTHVLTQLLSLQDLE
jgi:hypothetical protein